MKKVTTIIVLFLSVTIFAQSFQGKATYKTHQKFDFKMKKEKSGVNSDLQKQLKAQLMKQFQKTYTLNFDKSTSTYKQNEELSSPQAATNGMQIKIMGNGGGTDVLYKNVADKRFVNKTEISGKRFLIKDKLNELDWEMTSETKNIGNYTCYKATREREETRTSFSMTDGEREEKKEKVIVKTVAWYTPQIPVSNGPAEYWGLPGLILEINSGRTTVLCTEIVMNPSEKEEIKTPTKGKKITREDYTKTVTQKIEEMRERFQRGGRNGGGRRF